MSRIPPELADQTPLDPNADWLQACARIAEQAGFEIVGEQRLKLWGIVRSYCLFAYAEVQRPSATDAKREIVAIAEASERLNGLLVALDAEDRLSVRNLLRENLSKDQWRRFDRLAETVASLTRSCSVVLENFEYHVQGKPGRPKHPGFKRFVLQLEAFFRDAGHHASAAFSRNYPPEAPRWTPFVRFCWSVYETVPPLPGVPAIGSKSAFGEAVNGALEKGK